MAKPFPADEPFLNGYFAPLHLEADAQHLPVTGRLPPELNGTLYRIGPNPQFAPRGRYDWFAGDGMLHAFTLSQGQAAYRNRYVRTPKWQLEHAAAESLSSGGLGPSPLNDPRITELHSTLANTNVVFHAGHLLALEEAHAPFEVSPGSLEAQGYQTYGGELHGPMTAHPKIDPVNGELLGFGYQTKGFASREILVHVIGPDGQLRRSEEFMAPMASMLHDFCPTQHHVVLPMFPLTMSMERAQKGQPPLAWEPELGTHVAVLSRDKAKAGVRWFRGPASHVFHPLNAYDTPDGRIVCDMVQYEAPLGYRQVDGSPVQSTQQGARLVRWTLDPNGSSDNYTVEPLSDLMLEFPRIDERFMTLPHRHGFFVTGSPNPNLKDGGGHSGIAHIDLQTGATAVWKPALGEFCSEPVFVPRRDDAPEGDGWLLTVVYRGGERRSDLVVLDALDVAAGPVAQVHLSHRVPAGFHGNWVPAAA